MSKYKIGDLVRISEPIDENSLSELMESDSFDHDECREITGVVLLTKKMEFNSANVGADDGIFNYWLGIKSSGADAGMKIDVYEKESLPDDALDDFPCDDANPYVWCAWIEGKAK